MERNMTTLRNIGLALALAGAAASAHAGVKASATKTGFGVYTSSSAAVQAVLNDAGDTTVNFTLGSAGKKVLKFSAGCGVNAPYGNTSAWLDLDIIVNGVIVAPTVGSGDPFCSSNGKGGGTPGGSVRSSIIVPIQGIQGNNTVTIVARGNGGALGLFLANSSLVIHD
jgi:hypothetical protein